MIRPMTDEERLRAKEREEANNTYIATLEEDENGDLILPLNQDILNSVGWDIGDTLIWEESFNGSYILRKKDDSK
jgi:hypothetical protein